MINSFISYQSVEVNLCIDLPNFEKYNETQMLETLNRPYLIIPLIDSYLITKGISFWEKL